MRLLLLCLILISNLTIGQTLKGRLEGEWVCIGIFDSKGKPSSGKYGSSREYLRFGFKKNKLRISETPYDLGTVQNITLDDDIEIRNDVPIELPSGLPERNYTVKKLDNQKLTLSALNEQGQLIEYSFIRQTEFVKPSDKVRLDNGLLVIKISDLSNKYTTIENNIGEWVINNDSIHLVPSPLFFGKGYFGDAFANEVVLPRDFGNGQLSKELICEFIVSDKGAADFTITEGISESLDKEVLRVFGKLSKNWKLNEMSPRTSRVIFHMYFIKTNGEFVSPFKID